MTIPPVGAPFAFAHFVEITAPARLGQALVKLSRGYRVACLDPCLYLNYP